MMDYVLASYLALNSEPVRRKCWPQDVYVVIKGASNHIFAPKTTPTVWRYSREDFKAKDYERYHTGLCRSNPSGSIGATGNTGGLDTITDTLVKRPDDDSA